MITKNATTVKTAKRIGRKFKKAFRQFDKFEETQRQDKLIEMAINQLTEHPRGRRVLASFHAMAKAGADGLDISGFNSLMVLTQALRDGRRQFLDAIQLLRVEPEDQINTIKALIKKLSSDTDKLNAISGVLEDYCLRKWTSEG